MIFRDKVFIVTGGGRDEWNNVLPVVEEGPFLANVDPVSSTEAVQNGQPPLTLFYQLTIGRKAGSLLTPTSRVKWLGRDMTVQGDVEPWTVNGRIHHYEASLRAG